MHPLFPAALAHVGQQHQAGAEVGAMPVVPEGSDSHGDGTDRLGVRCFLHVVHWGQCTVAAPDHGELGLCMEHGCNVEGQSTYQPIIDGSLNDEGAIRGEKRAIVFSEHYDSFHVILILTHLHCVC